MIRASPGQGSHCRGQQSPNLADSAKKFSFAPAQPLRARCSQPHGGFKPFPRGENSALASKLCGMASQTPSQSKKQREERIFFSHLGAASSLVPISILHCTTVICRNCCASTTGHMLLPGRHQPQYGTQRVK